MQSQGRCKNNKVVPKKSSDPELTASRSTIIRPHLRTIGLVRQRVTAQHFRSRWLGTGAIFTIKAASRSPRRSRRSQKQPGNSQRDDEHAIEYRSQYPLSLHELISSLSNLQRSIDSYALVMIEQYRVQSSNFGLLHIQTNICRISLFLVVWFVSKPIGQVASTIFRWGHAIIALERSREMALIFKTGQKTDPFDLGKAALK